jgi:hypothetical protein
MPNYDPAVLAQMLRSKSGSAYTPAEMAGMQRTMPNRMTGAAMSPAEMAVMQAQQQQMAQQQMRQQAGSAMTPAEMQYYQQMQGQ